MKKLLLVLSVLLMTGCVSGPYGGKSLSMLQAEANLVESTNKLKAINERLSERKESFYSSLNSSIIGMKDMDFKLKFGFPIENNRSEGANWSTNQMVYKHPRNQYKRIYVYSRNGIITSYQR